jgi:hypothetical protein
MVSQEVSRSERLAGKTAFSEVGRRMMKVGGTRLGVTAVRCREESLVVFF